MSSVGLCGLGNMGAAIAGRLAAAGQPLLFDVDERRAATVAAHLGVEPVAAVEDLADADVVLLSLPNPAASHAVVATVAPRLRPGSVIVETSTVAPGDVERMAAAARVHGVGLLEAAVAAGVGQMTAGTAALLVGAYDDDFARALPVLETIAANVHRIGEPGAGAALKVINNAVAHAVMVVLVEAAALAEANGIDREHLIRLMTGNDAGLTRPLEHRLVQRIAHGDYEGGMPTEAALKDSVLALNLAQRSHVPVFAIGGSHAVYEMATAQGLGRQDYASIARLWEGWLGRPLSTER
jgi:3-hydroxyisobutyrate dehydrogenase-like beta-hydroxyacid dehydrogenase